MTNTHEARPEWPIVHALERLMAQDSWEQPYVMAANDALNALVADLSVACAQVERHREALLAAREGIVALHQAGWDNLRRDVATEALKTIDDFLAAVPDPEEDATKTEMCRCGNTQVGPGIYPRCLNCDGYIQSPVGGDG